jgi:GH43 family beta-xylosidase
VNGPAAACAREYDWVRVRLANGLEGFRRAEDVGLL